MNASVHQQQTGLIDNEGTVVSVPQEYEAMLLALAGNSRLLIDATMRAASAVRFYVVNPSGKRSATMCESLAEFERMHKNFGELVQSLCKTKKG
jgi:hypothetical protein